MANAKICAVDDCSKGVAVRGWCSGHYHRWQRYGSPTGGSVFIDNSGNCSVAACNKKAVAKGFCPAHYYHLRLYGNALVSAPPKVSKSLAWLIDNSLHADCIDCLKWPFATTNDGRPSMRMNGKTHIACREMCRLAHGEPPDPTYQAAHSCGMGHLGCINPNHLRWATQSENENDKLLHGTSNRGERHGMVKLTEVAVLRVRAAKGRFSQRKAAEHFGISRGTINDIWTGKTWNWLI